LLERVGRQSSNRTSVEDGFVLPIALSLEGRNDRIFEECEGMVAELKYFIFKTPTNEQLL
jgi:hypothetical protein